jgi:hypothetical protein
LPSPGNAVVLINFSMPKAIFLLLFPVFWCFSGNTQEDPQLKVRVTAMLKVTETKDLEKMLDYTYPKLFTLAPREQIAEAMKNSFETDEFVSTFDSVKIKTIFPVFNSGNGQYAKITHTILMRMEFKEEIDSAQIGDILVLMEEQYGKGNVRINLKKNTFSILLNSVMVAVKDEYAKEWSFLNYDEESPMVEQLLSKEVIQKLKEYK